MADINNKQWLVTPNAEVEKKWLECQIQERKSQIVRLQQDIEDLKKAQIVKLEATIIMLQKEMDNLLEQYNNIDNVIDIKV